MENIELLSDFASGPRLEILRMLEKSNMKSAQIAKNMNTSIQALSRHTERLLASKLIEKLPDGSFALTSIASACMMQMPFFEFLVKHQDFFSDHSFDGIPESLLSRLGELINGKLELNPMKAIQTTRDIFVDSQKWIFTCTFSIPTEILDMIDDKIKQGLKLKIIIGKNTFVPKGFYDHPNWKIWENAVLDGIIEERYIEYVPINILISDAGAHLLFANKELDKPFTPKLLFGNDDLFKNWCMDIFDYYWNDVPKLSKIKMQER